MPPRRGETEDRKGWAFPDLEVARREFAARYGHEPADGLSLHWFAKHGRSLEISPDYRPSAPEKAGEAPPASPAGTPPSVDAAPAEQAPGAPGDPPEPTEAAVMAMIEDWANGRGFLPDQMHEIEAYGRHAIRRAKERYGIDLTPADISGLAVRIERFEGKRLWKTKRGRDVYEIGVHGHRCRVAYDQTAHAVVTFLSPPPLPAGAQADPKSGGVERTETATAPDVASRTCPATPPGESIDEPMPDFTEAEAAAAIAPGRPSTPVAPAPENGYSNTTTSDTPASNITTEETKMTNGTTNPPPAPAAAVGNNGHGTTPTAPPAPAHPAAPPAAAKAKAAPAGPTFTKATKFAGRIRVALTGASGSGKTLSALMIARGIADGIEAFRGTPGRIALIDTENGSSRDYADRYDFDVLDITPPYSVDKYIAAIKSAEADPYDVIVVDSLSHAWEGEGGVLDEKEKLDKRGGSSFANWKEATKLYERLRATLLHNRAHMVCTLRSKQEFALEKDDKTGKQVVRKLGLRPIMREGLDYEFTVVLDMIVDSHLASVAKDRTSLFDGTLFVPTVETGSRILHWRLAGAPEPAVDLAVIAAAEEPAEPTGMTNMGNTPTKEQWARLGPLCQRAKVTLVKAREVIGIPSDRQLTADDMEAVLGFLEAAGTPDAAVAS